MRLRGVAYLKQPAIVSGDERKFLTEQREYMPREHRELIQWIEKESPVRKTAQGRQQALDALLVFRSVHLNTVRHVIIIICTTRVIAS